MEQASNVKELPNLEERYKRQAAKEYNEAFDTFAKEYMGLNEWGRIEMVFALRTQVNSLTMMLQKLIEDAAKKDLTNVTKP